MRRTLLNMDPISRAHVFVMRGGLMLALRQANGAHWWEQPGGTIEPGEDPAAAAIRETYEETGLRIEPPSLLREWSYNGRSGRAARAWMFVARSHAGDVRLSPEHSAFAWMDVDDYADRHCGPHLDARTPALAGFLAGMRINLTLLRDWQRSQAPM
jgi:8-oxo-dGTP pyrophosphatase MutT (NUDIX family)